RLFHEMTRKSREASELATLAAHLTETLHVEEVSDRIVAAVLPLFGVRSANIRLHRPDGSLVVMARGERSNAISAVCAVLLPGQGVSGRVVSTGQAFWTSDLLAERTVEMPGELF